MDGAGRDAAVIEALPLRAPRNPRWGFEKYVDRLRNTGHRWSHTRLWRVYCQLRLNLPRRTKKRVPARVVQSLAVRPWPNVGWAGDVRRDTFDGGRRVRTFTILDEGGREVFAIDVDPSLPAERVIRALEQVTAWRGQPHTIRRDNGPEFLADRVARWCADRGIALQYIQPGQPNQHACVERFNRTFRHEVLDTSGFKLRDPVREISAEWLRASNEERPHDTLDGIPPSNVSGAAISSPFIFPTKTYSH